MHGGGGSRFKTSRLPDRPPGRFVAPASSEAGPINLFMLIAFLFITLMPLPRDGAAITTSRRNEVLRLDDELAAGGKFR
jgi:hypothetical protein